MILQIQWEKICKSRLILHLLGRIINKCSQKAFRRLINWYFKIWHWSISRKQIKLTASIPHLHDGVGSQDFLLHVGLTGRAADRSKVSHGVFGWYRLSCSGLPAHNDRLVPLIPDKLNQNKKNIRICIYYLSVLITPNYDQSSQGELNIGSDWQ